jgi:uncharacterized protein
LQSAPKNETVKIVPQGKGQMAVDIIEPTGGAKALLWRIVRFPLIRVILGFVAVLLPVSLYQAGLIGIFGDLSSKQPLFQLAIVPLCVLALLAYWGFVRLVEQRPVSELGKAGAGREWGAGLGIGALMFCVTIGLIAALGSYHVVAHNGVEKLIPFIGLALMSGVVEEILLRGLFFRIIEEWLGSWIALALSAALFGALHLANPNATPTAAIAIALEAGVMLGAAYMVTQRLWLPIGLHMAWNFVQGGVFGVAVSGIKSEGLLVGVLSGPEWVSGGAFGAEASALAVLVGVVTSLVFLRIAARRGHVRSGFWARKSGQIAPRPA